jgi:hypothetical protein
MATEKRNDHESAAAGLDFDFPIRERAASLGKTLAEQGPKAFFDEIEELIPEPVRTQIEAFPLLAVGLGIGIGVFLGIKKGDELLAAGASLVSAAAATNIAASLERSRED